MFLMNVLLESIIYFHLWWMCSRLYQRWCCIALYHRNNNSVRKKNSFSGLSTVREHIFCRFQRGFEIKRFVLLVFLSTSLSMCDPSSPAPRLGQLKRQALAHVLVGCEQSSSLQVPPSPWAAPPGSGHRCWPRRALPHAKSISCIAKTEDKKEGKTRTQNLRAKLLSETSMDPNQT